MEGGGIWGGFVIFGIINGILGISDWLIWTTIFYESLKSGDF